MLAPLLQTIGTECWKGSSLIVENAADIPTVMFESTPAVVSYVILATLIYFIFFIGSITISEAISFGSIFNAAGLSDTMQNKNLINAVSYTAIFCIPVLALVIYQENLSPMNFLFILLALAAFLVLRSCLFGLTGWMKNCTEMLRKVSMNIRMHLIVFTTLAALSLVISYLVPSVSVRVVGWYVAAVGAICFILCNARNAKIFLEENYSLLFWFLYLCTLEILPLGLLISALIRL